jgi:hypothetical protein
VFRSTLQGLNQLVVVLSPLYKTTELAMIFLTMELDEQVCLINCVAQLMLVLAC